jgi:hypothetical protein
LRSGMRWYGFQRRAEILFSTALGVTTKAGAAA